MFLFVSSFVTKLSILQKERESEKQLFFKATVTLSLQVKILNKILFKANDSIYTVIKSELYKVVNPHSYYLVEIL